MKQWLYLPILVLLSVLYTRLYMNGFSEFGQDIATVSRAPASTEETCTVILRNFY